LNVVYGMKKSGDLKKLGLQGREHIIKNYHTNDTVRRWDTILKDTLAQPSKYERLVVHTVS